MSENLILMDPHSYCYIMGSTYFLTLFFWGGGGTFSSSSMCLTLHDQPALHIPSDFVLKMCSGTTVFTLKIDIKYVISQYSGDFMALKTNIHLYYLCVLSKIQIS